MLRPQKGNPRVSFNNTLSNFGLWFTPDLPPSYTVYTVLAGAPIQPDKREFTAYILSSIDVNKPNNRTSVKGGKEQTTMVTKYIRRHSVCVWKPFENVTVITLNKDKFHVRLSLKCLEELFLQSRWTVSFKHLSDQNCGQYCPDFPLQVFHSNNFFQLFLKQNPQGINNHNWWLSIFSDNIMDVSCILDQIKL